MTEPEPAELGPAFFDRPTLDVARELLGKSLVRTLPDGRELALPIEEVEAYDGLDDLASHARFGRTPRNAPMWGPPGGIYVYRIYGLHWMLNLVAGPVDHPAAILVRGAGGIVGPARLTRALAIDRSLNGLLLGQAAGLRVEDRGVAVPDSRVATTPRIGIDYAGDWASKPWRFVVADRQPVRATKMESAT